MDMLLLSFYHSLYFSFSLRWLFAVHHLNWSPLSGSSFRFTVTVAIPAVCVCVSMCSQSCFSDQLCFLPCAVRWAVSKSINMWKKHTSLWGTVHSFLVRSEVGGGQKGNKRRRGEGVAGERRSECRTVEEGLKLGDIEITIPLFRLKSWLCG